MTRRPLLAALVATACLAGAAPAVAALTQVPVKATSLREEVPGTGGTYLAWSQNNAGHRFAVNLFVQNGGGAPVRVNPRRTFAWAGSIDGTTLVYQQERGTTARSDIRLWNVNTHAASAPRGINTPRWEWHPTISGPWILFGRRSFGRNRWQVILHNSGTGHNIVLADVRGRNVRADPGQVNGNWAVWDVCGRACSVYRYDIAGRTTKKLPNTLRGRLQYAPSVGADGTAYYAHSGAGCGANVRLVEKPVGAPAQVLVAFKRGVVDVSTTSAVADQVTGTDVYYDRLACRTRGSDIYKVVVP